VNERQHAVTFENPRGHRLFGILHEPLANARQDVGIILLSPGIKNRVAPHRLYNKMAAAYVSLGFWVLRFDFYGLGDSEGEIREPLLANLYGSIQTGRYIGDTHAAMDWMRRTHGIERFVLGGLCGGGITGVLAGVNRRDLAGIIGLGLPVILDGSSIDKLRHMTTGQLARVRGHYLGKLFKPSAWLRLLTFKTDFRMLFRAFGVKGKGRNQHAGQSEQVSNLNPLFPPAFLSILTHRKPILLLFSGSDRLYAEYKEKFLQVYRERVSVLSESLQVEVVEDANHIFTFVEWQQDMLSRTRAWLQRVFPPQGHVEARSATSSQELFSAG
jgi:alpha/beta superfamily hydrolase